MQIPSWVSRSSRDSETLLISSSPSKIWPEFYKLILIHDHLNLDSKLIPSIPSRTSIIYQFSGIFFTMHILTCVRGGGSASLLRPTFACHSGWCSRAVKTLIWWAGNDGIMVMLPSQMQHMMGHDHFSCFYLHPFGSNFANIQIGPFRIPINIGSATPAFDEAAVAPHRCCFRGLLTTDPVVYSAPLVNLSRHCSSIVVWKWEGGDRNGRQRLTTY